MRPLTLDDAQALSRAPYVETVNTMMSGNAEVEALGRKRRTTVYGVGPAFAAAFHFEVAQGEFLPPDDPRAPRTVAVLGSKMNAELFREDPLGATIRVGGQRYRVVGVMQPKGTTLGFDLDDTAFIPTAKVLELFDRESVFEIQLHYESGVPVEEVVAGIRRIVAARHGHEDFTIVTQQQMLQTLGSVLNVLTFAVGALDIAVPALPVSYSPMFILLAESLAVIVGLVAGILPALRAARLEPVVALRTE